MAEFKLPERQKSMPFLSQLKRAVHEKDTALKELKERSDALKELRSEYVELETKIVHAKESMFVLLQERLSQGQVEFSQDYAKLIQEEIDALTAANAKKGGPSK